MAIYSLEGELPQEINLQNFKNTPQKIPVYFTKEILPDQWENNFECIFIAKNSFGRFYNPASNTWEFRWHHYDKKNYYYLHLKNDTPLKIEDQPNANLEIKSIDFVGYDDLKLESLNIIKSGRKWLGESVTKSDSKKLTYTLPNLISTDSLSIKGEIANASIYEANFNFTNGDAKISIPLDKINAGRYETKALVKSFEAKFIPVLKNGKLEISLEYLAEGGTGYLNEVHIKYPKSFNPFSETEVYYPKNLEPIGFNYSNNLENLIFLEDKNGTIVHLKPGSNWGIAPLSRIFSVNNNSINYPENLLRADFVQFEQHQNAQLLIIGSKNLKESLEAYQQYKNTQIPSSVEYIENIYSNYSGGKIDPTAIRNFLFDLKMRKNTPLHYVLLMGDASWDFKNITEINSQEIQDNLVPSYQSIESFNPLGSFASDDYYANLTKESANFNEDIPQNLTLSLAIGRIPVKTNSEVFTYLNKIKKYESNQKKLTIPNFTMVADNGDNGIHLFDTEDFSKEIIQNTPFKVSKIYLDDFELIPSNGIEISPAAEKSLIEKFHLNSNLIHFSGHGSVNGWTDEKIFTTKTILELTNTENLPILFTATCEFTKFDDPYEISGGELGILSSQGGWIGIISTSRPVFQFNNYLFGVNFYKSISETQNLEEIRLGDLFQLTKNKSGNTLSNRNIVLMGDPSLNLSWTYSANNPTIQINNQGVSVNTQTVVKNEYLEIMKMEEEKSTKNSSISVYEDSIIEQQIKAENPSTNLNYEIIIPKNNSQDQKRIYWAGENSEGKKYYLKEIIPTINFQKNPEENTLIQIDYLRYYPKNPDSLKISLTHFNPILFNEKTAYLILNDTINFKLPDFFDSHESTKNQKIYKIPIPKNTSKLSGSMKLWDINLNLLTKDFDFNTKESSEKKLILLYPNPINSGGNLSIQLMNNNLFSSKRITFDIYDSQGNYYGSQKNILLENNPMVFSLKNLLPPNLYFLKGYIYLEKEEKYIYFTEKLFIQ